MEHTEFLPIIIEARHQFENREVDIQLLKDLYQSYNQLDDIHSFLQHAQELFPSLNCGISSVYLKHRLKIGKIINGSYAGNNHTFLQLNDSPIIADITADQFGGPPIYLGQLQEPWSLESNTKSDTINT